MQPLDAFPPESVLLILLQREHFDRTEVIEVAGDAGELAAHQRGVDLGHAPSPRLCSRSPSRSFSSRRNFRVSA